MAIDANRLQRTIERRIKQNRKHIQAMAQESDPVLRDLFAVMTVREAAARFRKHPTSVREAMIEGKLDYRRSGDIWLITARSLILLWGQPTPPDMEGVELSLPRWTK